MTRKKGNRRKIAPEEVPPHIEPINTEFEDVIKALVKPAQVKDAENPEDRRN